MPVAPGDTDGADFLLWQQQFGTTPAVAAIRAVPEPATLALLVAVVLVIASLSLRRA